MNDILKAAAERAGVPLDQAKALIKELSAFTSGMAHAGDVPIPPFAWPDEHAQMLRDSFPGWEGLTRGEFNGTRAAVIWRNVCGYLLSDDEFYDWERKVWEHPKELVEQQAKSP